MFRAFRNYAIGVLCLIAIFLSAQTSLAALSLPATSCDSQLVNLQNLFPLVSGMTQEDGTKAFKYGSDNNSFASMAGSVVTINVNLLFTPDTDGTANDSFLKFNGLNAACTAVSGSTLQHPQSGQNTIQFNLSTYELIFNGASQGILIPTGLIRYIWIDVVDSYPTATKATYSYLVDVNGPQNPTGTTGSTGSGGTGWNDTDQPKNKEASGKRPVLIIPGIMGSKLYYENQLVWVDPNQTLDQIHDYFLQNLNLDSDGNSLKTIEPKSVIDEIRIVNASLGIDLKVSDSFKSFAQNLETNGYVYDSNYFYFPYDWRLDLNHNNELLKDKIEAIRRQTGFSKIDVVVHSMGGLVAKSYIRGFGSNDINKLIFVGTPHLGAPKSAKVLLEGDTDIPFNLLNKNTIKQLALNMPSTYQLLPNSKYFDLAPEYIQLGRGTKLDYNATKDFLKSKNLNESLIAKAESFFTKDLYDLSLEGINVYNIAGCGVFTQSRYIYNPTNEYIYAVRGKSGDGTVPLSSADYIDTQFTKKFYVKRAKHSGLPSRESARRLILDILKNDVKTYEGISNNTDFCNINGRQFNWRSPVEVHVYDQNGNHAGPTAEGFENNLLGVDYEIINGEKFIFIPTDDGNGYRIEARGEAVGSFDLQISDITNGEIMQTAVYNDVEISSASKIKLDVADVVLRLDYSGSNDFENLQPSSILNDAQMEDITAPVTVAEVTNHEKSAIISLSASDDDSGVLETKYSVNDSSKFKVYAESFEVTNEGINKIYYYSIDKAGNNESVKTEEVTIEGSGQVLGIDIEKPKVADGSLVLDATDNRTVYIIGTGGKKYGFTSKEVFWDLGYSFDNLIKEDLTNYELGGYVSSADRPHPDGSLVTDGQTIWFINNGRAYGFTTMEEFRLAEFNEEWIVRLNNKDRELIIK